MQQKCSESAHEWRIALYKVTITITIVGMEHTSIAEQCKLVTTIAKDRATQYHCTNGVRLCKTLAIKTKNTNVVCVKHQQ